MITAQCTYFIHFFDRLSYAKAADGITRSIFGTDVFAGSFAQVVMHTTLHDREKILRIAVLIRRAVEPGKAPVEPAMGKLHGCFGIIVFAAAGRAFIKSHDDIAADDALDIHHLLRTEQMFAAINMRTENSAFLCELSLACQ